MKFLRAAFIFMGLALSTLIFGFLTILCAFFLLFMPFRHWREKYLKTLMNIPAIWIQANGFFIDVGFKNKIHVQGLDVLNIDNWYLLIANHQSWLDILILAHAFKKKIPSPKFFMKKQLLWTLPIAGLACWVLGFPFMGRHTRAQLKKNPKLKGKDIETTRRACKVIKRGPTTLINFIEGTRFTPQKKHNQHSPYQHLLKPRAGGLAIVLEEMRDYLTGILDVTIYYSEKNMNFSKFIWGDFQSIVVQYELLPIEKNLIGNYYQDRHFRAFFQRWINTIWQKKDSQLDERYNNENIPKNLDYRHS